MKVVFLDIDGVLNCKQTANPRRFPYIVDSSLLARFNSVLHRTGAQVVLSSTWRCDPIGLFAAKHWGVPFTDVCPDNPNQPRREEILSWLWDHPDVTRFAVIDDEDDELDELPLFQPSATIGLTDKIADGVVRYLNGETNQVMPANALVRLRKRIQSVFKRDKS